MAKENNNAVAERKQISWPSPDGEVINVGDLEKDAIFNGDELIICGYTTNRRNEYHGHKIPDCFWVLKKGFNQFMRGKEGRNIRHMAYHVETDEGNVTSIEYGGEKTPYINSEKGERFNQALNEAGGLGWTD